MWIELSEEIWFDGERACVDVQHGFLFQLNRSAAEILAFLDEAPTRRRQEEEIIAHMESLYPQAPAALAADVREACTDLRTLGLVESHGEPSV